MPIKLAIILSVLTGLVFTAASLPAAAPQQASKAGKGTVTKAKAPATTKTAAKTTKGVPSKGSSTTASRTNTAATARRPATTGSSSRTAVYSRSNTRNYGRNTKTTARRGTVVSRPQTNWQSRPTTERYREIQQALADKGFFKGEVNGTWSADSVDALKNFQRAQNLDPDGKLGSLSLIALGLGPKRITAASNVAPPPPAPPPPTPSTPPADPNNKP